MPESSYTKFQRIFLMSAVLPLLFIAGIQLFVLSDKTETYFAWTIALPITAAFMGAGYWSALAGAYSALQQKSWPAIRTNIAASLAATGMLAVMTFMHLDKFHLQSPALITRFVTWVWIAVYAITPPIFLVTWIVQARRAVEPGERSPLPAWLRAGLALQAAFALLVGLGLFIVPQTVAPAWPWPLTLLTARAVGAWMTSYGVACAAVFGENDVNRGAGTISSLLAFCILELIVLWRFAASVDWFRPMAWVYGGFLLLGSTVAAAYLWFRRVRH